MTHPQRDWRRELPEDAQVALDRAEESGARVTFREDRGAAMPVLPAPTLHVMVSFYRVALDEETARLLSRARFYVEEQSPLWPHGATAWNSYPLEEVDDDASA